MKKQVFKSVALALAAFTVLGGLTACSGGKKADQVVNLTYWHLWSGDEGKDMQKIVDQFNSSHPKIHVKALAGTTSDKQLTALSGGQPPDVGYVLDSTLANWASTGALQGLDDYISKTGMKADNVPSAVWSEGQYEGKQYGIPYTMDTYMLFYNKDMLAQAGISTPPTTISEFKADALKLVKKDSNGDYTQLGFVSQFPWVDAVNMADVFGGSFYDTSSNKVTANSDAILSSVELQDSFYQAPYDRAKVIKFASGFGQYASNNNPFFAKKLAFDIEGEWYPTFIKQYAPNFNYGIANIPYPDGNADLKNSTRLQAGMLYISNACKNKDAAWTFVDWLLQDKNYEAFCSLKGSLPTTYSTLTDAKFKSDNPNLAPFISLVNEKNTKAFPSLPFADQYSTELTNNVTKVYQGTMTSKQALDAVVTKIQPLADKWKASKK
jgi:multiple sugar transport system substrate-binding protein